VVELLLVIGAVAALAFVGFVAPLVASSTWLVLGIGFTALGLAIGVPTGFWYHVRLRACLASRGALPPRWWLRPVSLHPRLLEEERPGVLRWFAIGGAGFVLTVVGCALIVLGVSLEAFRALA
jgi:hypothetical protein